MPTAGGAPSLYEMYWQAQGRSPNPQQEWSQYLQTFRSPMQRGAIPMDPFSAYRQNTPNYLPPGMTNPAPIGADAFGAAGGMGGVQSMTASPYAGGGQQGRGPPRPATPQMPSAPGYQPADWMRALTGLRPQQWGTGNAATDGAGASDPNMLRAGAMGAALMGGMPFGMLPQLMMGNFRQR